LGKPVWEHGAYGETLPVLGARGALGHWEHEKRCNHKESGSVMTHSLACAVISVTASRGAKWNYTGVTRPSAGTAGNERTTLKTTAEDTEDGRAGDA
jgi:hypothetical protein